MTFYHPKTLATRGALVTPMRLSHQDKENLLEQINSTLSHTNDNTTDDEISAMMWLRHRVLRQRLPVRSVDIARILYYWAVDNNKYELSQPAKQWVVNIVSKRYSLFELSTCARHKNSAGDAISWAASPEGESGSG